MKRTLTPHTAGLDLLIQHLGHELRAPLVAALVHLGGLERTIGALRATGASEALTSLAQMRQALTTLDRFIDRTLEVYRRGRVTVARERVELGPLVAAVVDRLEAASPGARSQIGVSVPDGAEARLDRTAVDEILGNLLSNALKFGQGKPIRVVVERQPDGVRLLVRDLGAGIELGPEIDLFDAFTRGAASRSIPGLGLGLWIVRQMVEAHEGRISVDTWPGEGTLFDVFLPG
jgi:signal transduction histidine kinase